MSNPPATAPGVEREARSRRSRAAAARWPRPPKVYPAVAVGQTWTKAGTQPRTVRVFKVDGHFAGLTRVDTGRRSHMAVDRLQRRFHLVEAPDA